MPPPVSGKAILAPHYPRNTSKSNGHYTIVCQTEVGFPVIERPSRLSKTVEDFMSNLQRVLTLVKDSGVTRKRKSAFFRGRNR